MTEEEYQQAKDLERLEFDNYHRKMDAIYEEESEKIERCLVIFSKFYGTKKMKRNLTNVPKPTSNDLSYMITQEFKNRILNTWWKGSKLAKSYPISEITFCRQIKKIEKELIEKRFDL